MAMVATGVAMHPLTEPHDADRPLLDRQLRRQLQADADDFTGFAKSYIAEWAEPRSSR